MQKNLASKNSIKTREINHKSFFITEFGFLKNYHDRYVSLMIRKCDNFIKYFTWNQ